MKKIVVNVEGEGLDSLLGKKVILFCMNYFYYGTLGGVNEKCVLLYGAHIVYETGPFDQKKWQDAQKLPTTDAKLYVNTASIESFGEVDF